MLPDWPPGTVAVLTTHGADPHAIPVSTGVRRGPTTILFALSLRRESLARLRAEPRCALTIVAGGDVAITAHGRATVVQEPMEVSDRVAAIRLDATRAVDGPGRERELGRTVELALGAFGEGRDPLVFTARGPDDPAVLEGIELALKGGQVGRPDFFLAAKAGGP